MKGVITEQGVRQKSNGGIILVRKVQEYHESVAFVQPRQSLSVYVVFGVWSESRNVQQKSNQVAKDAT